MGVGAAQDLAVEHSGKVDVGSITGAAHHLIRAVVAHRASTDDTVVFFRIGQDDIGFVIKHIRDLLSDD